MADLFARGVLEAILAHGRVVMNDYVFSVTEIEGGHRLHIVRGSEEQTLDVMDGPKGNRGDDGYSPRVNVIALPTGVARPGVLVTIRDVTGDHQFELYHGEEGQPGKDGVSPSVSTRPVYDASTGVEIGVAVDIIDAEELRSFMLYHGKDGTFENLTEEQREQLRGPAGLPGDKGENGGYYIPSMGVNGILSWTGSKDGMPGYTSSVSLKGPAGVSPQVSLLNKRPTDGSRGFTRLTITDAQGTHSSDILDGLDGEDGGYYVPTLNADGSITWKGSKDDMPNIGTGSHSLLGPPGANGKDGGYYTPKVVYYEDKNAFSIIWTPSDGAMNPVPSQLIPLPGGAAEMATDEEVLAMLAELGALPVAADSDGAVIVDVNGTIVM